DDRPRRRRDDDDRDRRSRRREDDDDDRRRRRRDDDDDYDDRPRRPSQSVIEGQFNRASLALLLNFIAGWQWVGALGLVAFVWVLDWIGVTEGLRVFLILAGVLGLGHWLTSAVGLGFMISGPRDRGALGLSIATAAVASLHLMLLIVIGTSVRFGGFGSATAGHAADVHWDSFITQARAIPVLLFFELGIGDLVRGVSAGSLVPVFANLTEVARMILFLLTLRAFMLCTRDSRGAKLGMQAAIGYGIAAGALILLGVLFGLLLLAARPAQAGPGGRDTLQAISTVQHLFFLVLFLALAGMAVGVTLIGRAIKNRIDYRP
ncbi:MAG: hypothetical protein J2P46_16595, partial [Zavarzinella sp.]|nr:hypothetical protein [Zavarzinella sp.]